jgi:hypothetical protein
VGSNFGPLGDGYWAQRLLLSESVYDKIINHLTMDDDLFLTDGIVRKKPDLLLTEPTDMEVTTPMSTESSSEPNMWGLPQKQEVTNNGGSRRVLMVIAEYFGKPSPISPQNKHYVYDTIEKKYKYMIELDTKFTFHVCFD